jgi:hypothetical protein
MMVKADENANGQRRSGWVLIAVGLLYEIPIGGAVLLSGFASHEPSFLLLIFLGPLGFILGGTLILVKAPRWQRFEQRRQAAASADQAASYLATAQPAPDEAALPLPFTIKIRPNLLGIILFVGCLLLVVNGWVFTLIPDASHYIFISLIVTGSFLLILAILFFIVMRQRIEVTEQGITIDSIIVQRIRWQDARLFAILSANLVSKRNHLTGGYELSGPGTIVRWTRLSPGLHFSVFRFMLKPALPFDEYDRQMDALLSVIAAKTGLPLYDLR